MNLQKTIIGIHAASETIAVNINNIQSCLMDKDYKNSPRLLNLYKKLSTNKISIKLVSQKYLYKINNETQGVVLFIKNYIKFDEQNIFKKDRSIIIILDSVTDPQNLGSILRTCWLLKVDGIIVPKKRTANLTPTACKIASGGAEHVPINKVTNIGPEILKLKEYGYWVYALDNKKEYKSLWDVKFDKKIALIAGSEGSGIRAKIMEKSDQVIRIPQINNHASLNVAASLAISLAEVNRQQT